MLSSKSSYNHNTYKEYSAKRMIHNSRYVVLCYMGSPNFVGGLMAHPVEPLQRLVFVIQQNKFSCKKQQITRENSFVPGKNRNIIGCQKMLDFTFESSTANGIRISNVSVEMWCVILCKNAGLI